MTTQTDTSVRTRQAPVEAKDQAGQEADTVRRIRDVFTNGQVYKKLFALRRRHPEVSAEVDDIVWTVSAALDKVALIALGLSETRRS